MTFSDCGARARVFSAGSGAGLLALGLFVVGCQGRITGGVSGQASLSGAVGASNQGQSVQGSGSATFGTLSPTSGGSGTGVPATGGSPSSGSGGTRSNGSGGANSTSGSGGTGSGGSGSGGSGAAGASSFPMPVIDPQGFTTWVKSSDTQVTYVSSSTGQDRADYGTDPSTPLKTAAAGIARLRDGSADWLLFKRGDQWAGGLGNWDLSGRSATEPIIVGAYGTGARPLFMTGVDTAVDAIGASGAAQYHNHVWFVGLEFRANGRDPNDPAFVNPPPDVEGIHWRRGTMDLLFEDCVVRFYGTGITFQDSDMLGISGVKLRRCQILDNYDVGNSHSQGIYVSGMTSLLLEENLFDHNGWNETVSGADKTIFNHNAYIDNGNTNVVVKNNIFLRASSHGIQLRPGGVADGNLFVYNALSLLVGGGNNPEPGGVDGEALDNVILLGTDIGTMPKEYGIVLDNIHLVTVANNIVANATTAMAAAPLDSGVAGVTYTNNIVYNWPLGQMTSGSYADPSRDLGTYDATLGGPGTFDHLVQGLRSQSQQSWRTEYMAQTMNAYFKAGFAAH